MLDPRRFFAHDVTPTELRALEAWAAETGRVSRAGGLRVRTLGRVRAMPGGPHCEVLFGPLRADACACGRMDGPEHRGVPCPRCGVTPGDPSVRATRWAHVACRVGVAHPALVAAVPPASPAPPDDDDERSPLDALEARCGASLRVHHIPISPPAGRVAPPLPRGLVPTPTAEDLAVARLVAACARLDQLAEYGGPSVLQTHAQEAAAAALRDLCSMAVAQGERSIFHGPEGSAPILAGRAPPHARTGGGRPLVDGLAFWNDQLVSTGRSGLRVTSLRTGRGRRIAAGPCRVLGVVGDVAVFDGQDTSLPRFAPANGWAALDLSTGRWQTELPGAPRLEFGKDQPEDAWAVEIRTGRIAPLEVASDRPSYGAYTPALDALLVLGDDDGPLIDGDTGLTLLDLGLLPDAPARGEGGRRLIRGGWDHGRGGPPAIVHLGGRRWRVLLPSGAVGELDEQAAAVRWVVRGRYSAAAFSPDGSRLAVAQGGRIRVLDPDGALVRMLTLPASGSPAAR